MLHARGQPGHVRAHFPLQPGFEGTGLCVCDHCGCHGDCGGLKLFAVVTLCEELQRIAWCHNAAVAQHTRDFRLNRLRVGINHRAEKVPQPELFQLGGQPLNHGHLKVGL